MRALLLCFLLLLLGRAAAAQVPPALANAPDDAERARVSALIGQARGEGVLDWTGIFVEPAQADTIFAGFKAYYGLGDAQLHYVYANSGEVVNRVEQLVRAQRPGVDLVWLIAWDWLEDLKSRGELLKYDSPYYSQYTLSAAAGLSEPGYFVSDAYGFSPMYNPEAMASHGLKDWNPTSWEDFTDPRLKGLTSVADIATSTAAAPQVAGVVGALGRQWVDKLAKDVQPVLWFQSAQGRDWVISGEFPLTLHSQAKNAVFLREHNIPVRLVYPKEGIVLSPFSAAILKVAAHPAMAKLFIDYVRSARGAQAVMDAGVLMLYGRPGVVSRFPDLLPPWEEVNAMKYDWSTARETQDAAIELFREDGLGR